jgi:hypothetical protein
VHLGIRGRDVSGRGASVYRGIYRFVSTDVASYLVFCALCVGACGALSLFHRPRKPRPLATWPPAWGLDSDLGILCVRMRGDLLHGSVTPRAAWACRPSLNSIGGHAAYPGIRLALAPTE